jgi:hypothetical protein
MATIANTAPDQAEGPHGVAARLDASFRQHLELDKVILAEEATPRNRFEAVAQSVRDMLAERWLQTDRTYRIQNPKRVYYPSRRGGSSWHPQQNGLVYMPEWRLPTEVEPDAWKAEHVATMKG